jgi:RNA-binding protein
MQFLGKVQEVTFDGRIIVKGSFAPLIRSRVVDNRNKIVGKVLRIFGPVDSPYVAIAPTGDFSLLSAIGKQVYVEGVEEHGKTKGRDRRS